MSDNYPDHPSWAEVKKVLDDPNVPVAQKQDLIRNLKDESHIMPHKEYRRVQDSDSDENPMDASDKVRDELAEYEKKYPVDYDKTSSASESTDLKGSYDAAKKSADAEGGYDKAVKDGKGALEDIKRKSSDGSAGVSNSNELLDKGKPALEYFSNFSPIYKDVPGHLKQPPKGDTSREGVEKRYDEQRDINFANFQADIEELKNAAKTQRDQSKAMADRMTGVWNGWSGGASQASQKAFADMNAGASKVGDYLSDTAEIAGQAIHQVSDHVNTKTSKVLDCIKDVSTVDGKGKDQVRKIVDVATNNFDDDKLKEVCGYFNIEVDDGCLDDENFKTKVANKAQEWIGSVFSPNFQEKYNGVIGVCDEAKKAVDDAWKVLTDHLGKVEEDPFKNPGGNDKPGGEQKPGGGGQQGGG